MGTPIKTILIVCILLLSASVFSQSRWQNASLFISEDDSISCLVDVVKTENNCEFLYYRTLDSEEEKKLEAGKFLSVSTTAGRKFVSKEITLENEERSVLAEYLVDGIIDMLVFMEGVEYYYILEAPGKPQVVARYELKKAKLDEQDVKVRSYKHIGMLKALMADAPELHEEISYMPMDQEHLVNISKKYHDLKCTTGEACLVYSKEDTYQTSMLAPMVGAEFGTMRIKMIGEDSEIVFGSAPGFSLGGVIDIPISRKEVMLDFEVEAYLSRRVHSGTFTVTDAAMDYVHHLDYNYLSLRANPGIRMQVRPDKLSYVFFAGPALSFSVQRNMSHFEERYRDGVYQFDYDYEDAHYGSALYGLSTYAGLMFPVGDKNMLLVKLRYQLLTGKIDATNLYTNGSSEYRLLEHAVSLSGALYF